MTTVTQPILRYYGGKWRIADWIIAHFPQHETYVDLFGGGASVLLRKPPSRAEVFNDIDSEVVNFFKVLRDRPEELARAVVLTPWSRAEYYAAYEHSGDDLERARRFLVRSWMGIGSPVSRWRSGFRVRRDPGSMTQLLGQWNKTPAVIQAAAQRFKEVIIECDDFRDIIERYDTPDTLFYCDPPYLMSVRIRKWAGEAYRHEMSENDHRKLAEMLNNIRGTAIVSGYPSRLYDELFGDWRKVERQSCDRGQNRRVECLWIHPRARYQLLLWAEGETS